MTVSMYCCVDVLMCWWLCRCIDVLMCWCVDDCVDVLMCWCVDLLCTDVLMCCCVNVLLRWRVDVLKSWCVDVLMCCVDVLVLRPNEIFQSQNKTLINVDVFKWFISGGGDGGVVYSQGLSSHLCSMIGTILNLKRYRLEHWKIGTLDPHQHINTSTHQHINISTYQHINTSTPQHINTSTHVVISTYLKNVAQNSKNNLKILIGSSVDWNVDKNSINRIFCEWICSDCHYWWSWTQQSK